ncbi:MAG: integrase core domain-containing protein [Pseudomonadota bacterium]|nr:integrase core domain-containing protein [Pseudomonadota bacterium]
MIDYVARASIAPDPMTIHADNGAVMKGSSLYETFQDLKIATSHSRPGVSNDNPFIESLFRTIKYRPQDTQKPFATLTQARAFADRRLHWYNQTHRHSSIHYVTPSQRNAGEGIARLEKRKALYQQARKKHPGRWSGQTRKWNRKAQVHLNPCRSCTRFSGDHRQETAPNTAE